jgi:hypothetical protein
MNSKSTITHSSPKKRQSQRLNNKAKTGRRASEDERVLAAEILKSYATNKDISVLILSLERFAQNGSFLVNEKHEQDLMIAAQHRAHRSSGLTVEKSIEKLAAENKVSDMTVKRRIANASKNPLASENPLVKFLQTQLALPHSKNRKP